MDQNSGGATGRNRLADETSPYLLQHKDNPVHWWAWGEDAFAAARAADKPILLSIGYAACHWCHVMAHESFENEATAALMNELFINVKVDREERPDVDTIYQAALGMMGEHGGWPLTMFLTPGGEPYWGGTYFPPASLYGRPGFPDVLTSLANAYGTQKDQLKSNIEALKAGLDKMARPDGGGTLTMETLDTVATSLLRAVDPMTGGTMGAPKFPQPGFFQFLWRAYRRTGSPLFRDAVTLTLDHISQGGIYDHLGGGYARYSTDDHWLAPHFEKMLYDNALLIDLLTDAWLVTGSGLYETRVRETVEWACREMRAEAGVEAAFASAYDADSEGEEGKFYVWSEDEIDEVLGDAALRFKATYDVTPFGNWEGKTILNRSAGLELGDAAEEAVLAKAREKLLAVRGARVWPGRDDKVLADWNGLMIAALARAAGVFSEPDWLARAESAFRFVQAEMSEGGRLRHSWCEGRAQHPAVIEDYANMARAALALFEATGAEAYLGQARDWVAAADAHHWDAEHHGYFMNAADTDDLIARPKPIHDNATPPGNGTMTDVLARLHHLTGEAAYRERADQLLTALTPAEPEKAVHQLSMLMGFEVLQSAVQVVIAGPAGDAADAMAAAALRGAPTTRLILRVGPEDALPADHPAAGKGAVDGRPTAYVCVGTRCTLPMTDLGELEEHLRGL
ncbi:MAG: thioredoxin domain-containing protein [Magnetovibrio sp.]|nr:thioredoxin domain-containing protein [Magnetovibrio sp.]